MFVHRRDKCFRSSVEGVGVEKDFYGGPLDTRVDDAITDTETALAETVQALNAHGLEAVPVEDVATLMAAISVRTKALRTALKALAPTLVSELSNQFEDVEVVQRALLAQANDYRWLNSAVDSELRKYKNALQRESLARFKVQLRLEIRAQFSDPSSPAVQLAHECIGLVLERLRSTATDIADRAFLQAVGRDALVPTRVEQLKRLHFRMIPGDHFVLGDCGVVALCSDGRPRLVFGAADENIEAIGFLMPISPTQCLFATTDPSLDSPTESAINKVIASLSCEFFISNTESFPECELLRAMINTADPFDAEDAIRRHVREASQ